jgi:hypothetical protein
VSPKYSRLRPVSSDVVRGTANVLGRGSEAARALKKAEGFPGPVEFFEDSGGRIRIVARI